MYHYDVINYKMCYSVLNKNSLIVNSVIFSGFHEVVIDSNLLYNPKLLTYHRLQVSNWDKAWHKQYPPDEWEIERNKRIKKIQGNSNEFISLSYWE